MIKAVLFDLDNTLMDFFAMTKNSVEAAAEAMVTAGLNLPLEKVKKDLHNFYYEYGVEGPYPMTEFLRKHDTLNNSILEAGVEAYRKTKPGKERNIF